MALSFDHDNELVAYLVDELDTITFGGPFPNQIEFPGIAMGDSEFLNLISNA